MGERKKKIFLDAESDGLYGKLLSIAVIVLDEDNVEIERNYWGLDLKKAEIKSEWVETHVLPIMGQFECCENEEEMLGKFWAVWSKYKETAYVVVDVGYPVEMRVFEKCVQMNLVEREYQGPYPMIDLSSILLAKGIEPLTERKKLVEHELSEQHNALVDVETSIEIWKKFVEGEESGQ